MFVKGNFYSLDQKTYEFENGQKYIGVKITLFKMSEIQKFRHVDYRISGKDEKGNCLHCNIDKEDFEIIKNLECKTVIVSTGSVLVADNNPSVFFSEFAMINDNVVRKARFEKLSAEWEEERKKEEERKNKELEEYIKKQKEIEEKEKIFNSNYVFKIVRVFVPLTLGEQIQYDNRKHEGGVNAQTFLFRNRKNNKTYVGSYCRKEYDKMDESTHVESFDSLNLDSVEETIKNVLYKKGREYIERKIKLEECISKNMCF